MSEIKNLNDDEFNKIAINNAFKEFYKKKTGEDFVDIKDNAIPQIPEMKTSGIPIDFQSKMEQETDPDLMVGYEIIDLPSKGQFYENGIDKIKIEYLTSKDEDILTTPSLIEDGTVMDIILKRKIKTPNIKPEDLLIGDRNALIVFLRASSYGHNYDVEVYDPRNSKKTFKDTVDLRKLKYKYGEKPDSKGEFSVDLPMRKKNVKFKLLTSGQERQIMKKAENIQEAYNLEHNEYSTMKLKAQIVEINGKRDRSYIEKFVDAMPLLDTLTIKRKIIDVSPDIDMSYEFKTSDGFKFTAQLSIGIDFFFPSL